MTKRHKHTQGQKDTDTDRDKQTHMVTTENQITETEKKSIKTFRFPRLPRS